MRKDIRASIDIGSNSILLLIAEVSNQNLTILASQSHVTQLGKLLDQHGMFHDVSMENSFTALRNYVLECEKWGIAPQDIICTATEAARVAKNAVEFFERVRRELNLNAHIISSDAEAYYSAKGILYNTHFESEIATIMDIGGASTELIKVNTKSQRVIESVSMPIGAVRASQWLEDNSFVQNLQKIFLDNRGVLDSFQTPTLHCVAGTMTSLANMYLGRKDFHESDVHGLNLKTQDIEVLFKNFSDFTIDQFQNDFPFLQKRSESIRGGLHLVYHLLHRLMVNDILISTYGLRYGTLIEGQIKQEHLYGSF